MSISAKQYNDMIAKWLGTSEGKKYLADSADINPYTEEEMRAIASELYTAIVEAYKAEVKTPGADYFDMSTIRVGKSTKGSKGKTRLRVTFDAKGLSRRSLHRRNYSDDPDYPYSERIYYNKRKTQYDDWQFTGRGVYDIFGLFTQGYATKQVYGEWWDNESDRGEAPYPRFKGASLSVRQGSDFIARTIEEFKRKYPSIEVEYPRLWGGTK